MDEHRCQTQYVSVKHCNKHLQHPRRQVVSKVPQLVCDTVANSPPLVGIISERTSLSVLKLRRLL